MKHSITITWRDENYGSNARRHAFRVYDAFNLPEAQHAETNDAIKAAGFEIDGRRGCWASDDDAAPARLLTALANMRLEVEQAGYTRHEAAATAA